GANVINVLSKGGEKTVLSVHTHISNSASFHNFSGRFYKTFIRFFYNRADAIVAVSEGVKQDLVESFGVSKDIIHVIYNPCDAEDIARQAAEPLGGFEFLKSFKVISNAGRLSEPKGQWHLIRIFSEIKKSRNDAKLVIMGDGDYKKYLIGLAQDLGLSIYDHSASQKLSDSYDVYFLGFQKNVFKFIANSSLAVSTSIWEGFSLGILEAMACGVCAISTDCASGPREILAPGTDVKRQATVPEFAEFGILMPILDGKRKTAHDAITDSERQWGLTLDSLLSDSETRNRYATKGKERLGDFSIAETIRRYEQILS
ncbi:MAG: glycosyl transferase family 1, partial [Patescibacteria group bacterium]|nr:glycosyl transferase family 1 [Patescibacteria group bacterium]